MDIPHHVFMQNRHEVTRIGRYVRLCRVLSLSRVERHRAIYILFKINTSNVMRRAYWTIRVTTMQDQKAIFVWCPREDPIEAPFNAYTRVGRLVFDCNGSFILGDDGEETEIKEMRLQRVRLHYMCPRGDCEGNVKDDNGTGPLVCDRCDFCVPLTQPS